MLDRSEVVSDLGGGVEADEGLRGEVEVEFVAGRTVPGPLT